MIFYNRRWWILIIGPVVYLLYLAFLEGSPEGVAPVFWAAFGIVLLASVALGLIALGLWIVLGFLSVDPIAMDWRAKALRRPQRD